MPFKLDVPLDASSLEEFDPKQKLKVLARDAEGTAVSTVIKFDERGRANASLTFEKRPGPLHLLVGPADATDEQLTGLQTLSLDVPDRQWGRRRQLKLRPILIPPYYWRWWLRWCRTFTITGRLLCADGSPVPGAEVCAYDVDWWFVWSSSQLLGCDTTDENGTFALKFNWCCGWWPWWWWRRRFWRLDPDLVARVDPVLALNPDLKIAARTNQPSLQVFGDAASGRGFELAQGLEKDVKLLENLRQPLLRRLPRSLELERLRIWPWWPWRPWWDCRPDVVFKATQDCEGAEKVVFEESCFECRPNIEDHLDVDLTANDEACCLPICPEPCPEGECLVVDRVCATPIDRIGGNLGAPASPVGFVHPGAAPVGEPSYNRDRAFAGTAKVFKLGTMIGVDYYEVVKNTLAPLPTGAELNFNRGYWDTASGTFGSVPFPVTILEEPGGTSHKVYESREHHEAASGLVWDQPGGDRWWTSGHKDLVVPLNTRAFTDAAHRFQVTAWNVDGAGKLVNARPLPVCGSGDPNEWVVAFNNRITDELGHPASHNCGEGIHLCTSEPDTHFISVKIDGVPIDPCGVVDASEGELEIRFLVHDPSGQLARYTLNAHYGLNQVENLLQHATSVTADPVAAPLGTESTGWDGSGVATYGVALGQAAVEPDWFGAIMTLRVQVADAFPIPCCYLLRLAAWRRTIQGCSYAYPQRNWSEYTLGVGVCDTPVVP